MPEYNVATCHIFVGYTCDINGHDGIDVIPASLGWKKNHVNYLSLGHIYNRYQNLDHEKHCDAPSNYHTKV